MSFSDALADTAPTRVQLVDQILAGLEEEDRTAALAALRDRSVSADRIAAAFTKLGKPVSAGTVKNWRKKCGLH